MPPRLPIPKELLEDNPDLTIYEIRDILNVILKAKNNRMRQAHIFKVVLPRIGVLRSRGNKRPKRRQKTLRKDRERKRLVKTNKKK